MTDWSQFTLEELEQKFGPQTFKRTGGRRKGKSGPGPVDKFIQGPVTNYVKDVREGFREQRAREDALVDELSRKVMYGHRWDEKITLPTSPRARALEAKKSRELGRERYEALKADTKTATNNAVTDVSTNAVDKTTSKAEQTAWTEKTTQTQNPDLYGSDYAPEQGGSAVDSKHAEAIERGTSSSYYETEGIDPITGEETKGTGDTPMRRGINAPMPDAAQVEQHRIDTQGGLKISQAQAADLVAMIGKKLMEPKNKPRGQANLNNPQWRAARGYSGSDFIRSWG